VEVSAEEGQIVIRYQGEEVDRHPVVPPGSASIKDEHYGGAARRPSRAVRPRSTAEHAFLTLGHVAERFLRDAAAAGTTRLESVLSEVLELEAAFGREQLVRALERAVTYRRFRPTDVRAILEAGVGVQTPTRPGETLALELPLVTTRPLSARIRIRSLLSRRPAGWPAFHHQRRGPRAKQRSAAQPAVERQRGVLCINRSDHSIRSAGHAHARPASGCADVQERAKPTAPARLSVRLLILMIRGGG